MPVDDRPAYLDNHATTPVDRRVLEVMLPFFAEDFGNPASVDHRYGWVAQEAVERARTTVAKYVGAQSREIIFTSGATESDNLAVLGVVSRAESGFRHVVTVKTEHKAVLDPVKSLRDHGWEVTLLNVDFSGCIDLDELRRSIRRDTALVSIMSTNNEIGVEQPINEIARIVEPTGALFHTDAAQGFGHRRFDVAKTPIDLMSISGHKIYGPKGIGAAYVSRKAASMLEPVIRGGGHERGLRSGTLNTPGIVGLGAAVDILALEGDLIAQRVRQLRDLFEARLSNELEGVTIVASNVDRHPGNSCVIFDGVAAQSLLTRMQADVAASKGSACSSATPEPSHVLRACGYTSEQAMSAVRFGFGRQNTSDEVDRAVEATTRQADFLRSALLTSDAAV